MILADTSAWIEYDRLTGSVVDQRMTTLVAEAMDLAVTDPVVMEVLVGARDDDRKVKLRRLLLRCTLLPFEARTDFDSAVRIYRRCRAVGVTPRGTVDCMIAAVAWRTGASLLAQDADIVRVAHVMGIALDPASLGGA